MEPLSGESGNDEYEYALQKLAAASMEPLSGESGNIYPRGSAASHAAGLQWSRSPERAETIQRLVICVNLEPASMEPLSGESGNVY